MAHAGLSREGSMTRIGFVVAAVFALAFVLFPQGHAPRPAWAVASSAYIAEPTAKPLSDGEIKKIESYMRQVFGNPGIRLVRTPPDADVYLGEHFLGVVYPDDDKHGRTFYFEMSIFDTEVEESPPARRHR
jgi:hypothetical protein